MVNYLFIGNPGTGKSTLINCIIGEVMFKSGVSIGSGLTYQMDVAKTSKGTFYDTPGLDDVKIREKAAQEIKKALQQEGEYKIFFVGLIDSGRLRSMDVNCLKVILDCCEDIKECNIIFNKLTNPVKRKLEATPSDKLEEDLFSYINVRCKLQYLMLSRIDDLDDLDNQRANIPDLDSFVQRAQGMIIHSKNVKDIQTMNWEEDVKKLETVIKDLQVKMDEERKAMEQQRQEDKVAMAQERERIDKQREQDRIATEKERAAVEERYRKDREAQSQQHEMSMKAMEEQRNREMQAINAQNEEGRRERERIQERYQTEMNRQSEESRRLMQEMQNQNQKQQQLLQSQLQASMNREPQVIYQPAPSGGCNIQ